MISNINIYIFYSNLIVIHAGSYYSIFYWYKFHLRDFHPLTTTVMYQWKAQAEYLKSNESQKENHLNEFSSSLAVSDAVILIIIIIIIVVFCKRRIFFITNSYSHCCLNQSLHFVHPFMCKLFLFRQFCHALLLQRDLKGNKKEKRIFMITKIFWDIMRVICIH